MLNNCTDNVQLAKPIYDEMRQQLATLFHAMMRRMHIDINLNGTPKESLPVYGDNVAVNMLATNEAQQFIQAHADILDNSLKNKPLSETMRLALKRSNYIFSGIKTFHEINEAFPELIDSNGNRKPFEQFLNDVRKVDETYNKNYLRAEYNFAQQAADMAAKWEQFQKDYEEYGDRYLLQYRTAADSHVRPAHAALHGITLSPSHPFWKLYFPPNGWNCRCTVEQVRADKYPATPDTEVKHLVEQNNADNPKEAVFRFNPGGERKTFPDDHPYFPADCKHCAFYNPTVKARLSTVITARVKDCYHCPYINGCINKIDGYVEDSTYGKRLLINERADQTELADNIRAAKTLLDSFQDMFVKIREHVFVHGQPNPEYEINGLIADRKGIMSPKGISSGFKKAIKQGCQIVVIDLDMHMRERMLDAEGIARYLNWRNADFENGTIKECYIIYRNKAICIDATHTTRESIIEELEKLKQ